MENPKFQILTGNEDQFYFHLKARNGEIILSSEGYTTKDSCQNGIESVQENAPNDERYDRKDSVDGQFYFVLKAANGESIGKSEIYTTEQAREDGIASVKENAPDAPTEDTT